MFWTITECELNWCHTLSVFNFITKTLTKFMCNRNSLHYCRMIFMGIFLKLPKQFLITFRQKQILNCTYQIRHYCISSRRYVIFRTWFSVFLWIRILPPKTDWKSYEWNNPSSKGYGMSCTTLYIFIYIYIYIYIYIWGVQWLSTCSDDSEHPAAESPFLVLCPQRGFVEQDSSSEGLSSQSSSRSFWAKISSWNENRPKTIEWWIGNQAYC